MRRKIALLLSAFVFFACFFSPCLEGVHAQAALAEQKTNDGRRDYTEFIGETIGVITGGVGETVVREALNGIPAYYTDKAGGIEDVRKGRVSGFATDLSSIRVITALPGNEDLTYAEIPAKYFIAPMGAASMNQDIVDRFNAFLAGLKADGTLDEMQLRWLETTPDLDSPMPDIPNTGENGVITVATCATAMPFVYSGTDGEFKGYSIELALRFGAHEGMKIEFADMDFGGMLPYIISGKADLALANISITEERKKSVLFTDSVYDDRQAIIVLKTGMETVPPVETADRDYTYFEGKTLGVTTGTICDEVAEMIHAACAYYTSDSAGIEDVRKGRIDGFMYDLSTARVIVNMEGNGDLDYIKIPTEFFVAPVGAFSVNQDVIDRFNAFFAELEDQGIVAEMQDRWLNNVPDLDSPMPDIPNTGENGTFRVATYAQALPLMYMGADGEFKGYSAELALRFGAREGMKVEFTDMDFSGMIPYVVSGKADFGIANVMITEERKKSVLFTDSIYDDQEAVIVLKQTDDASVPAGTDGGFGAWLRTGVERNLIKDNRWKLIVSGLSVTLIIALAAQVLGTIFGCLVCYVLTRKSKIAQWFGSIYCGLIHGTPVVVLLMISYYIIFGNSNISSIVVAIVAFTMVEGAIIGQNLKGAIDTVDPVEIEAARSIGFPAFPAFLTVTLPQAVRRALPSYTNGFVELVKATAIVGYIAIQDLTRAADIIRSRTYDAYFPLLLVALIYLIVTTILVQIFKFAVKKLGGGAAR